MLKASRDARLLKKAIKRRNRHMHNISIQLEQRASPEIKEKILSLLQREKKLEDFLSEFHKILPDTVILKQDDNRPPRSKTGLAYFTPKYERNRVVSGWFG